MPSDDAEGSLTFKQLLNPEFYIVSAVVDDEKVVNLYMEVFERVDREFVSLPVGEWHLLAQARAHKLTMFPVFTNPSAQRYMNPQLKRFVKLEHVFQYELNLPQSVEDFEGIFFVRLGRSFYTDMSKGLGLQRELFPVWESLANIPGVTALVIHENARHEFFVRQHGDEIHISNGYLERIFKTSKSIYRKYTDEIRSERKRMGHNMLLTELNAEKFPVKLKKRDSRPLVDCLRDAERQPEKLNRQDRAAAIEIVRTQLPQLVKSEPGTLVELQADIERITLDEMIAKFAQMLAGKHVESTWQKLFEEHQFLLTVLFARDVRLLAKKPQTRSAGVLGTGSQFGDFLFSEGVGGLALVEIKRPDTKLVGSLYRSPDLYSIHEDLSGAVNQVLYQRINFIEEKIANERNCSELRDRTSAAIKCVVIAGKIPEDKDRRTSFDLYRNASKDVEIITFDEMYNKLLLLQTHLKKAERLVTRLPDDVPF